MAHKTELNTISVPPSGKYLATTSARGTLVRIWDSVTGKAIREFRRGSDKAVIYGVAFRPDEQEVCVWSDKGTVHVFSLAGDSGGSSVDSLSLTRVMLIVHDSNRYSTFSPLTNYLPIPKYFGSEWSYAQYRIPVQSAHISLSAPPSKPPTADVVDEEKCSVGWIQVPTDGMDGGEKEYQLIALTYTGGWYRLAMPPSTVTTVPAAPLTPIPQHLSISPPSVRGVPPPRPRSSSGSSVTGKPDKGKGRERDRDKDHKESRDCTLKEFRRYGRWDGWG